MIKIRPALWPQDVETLSSLDTSYTTERVYRSVLNEMSFRLVEDTVSPALRKVYRLDASDAGERATWDYAVIAEDGEALAGFAAAQYTVWNRRATLWHLYVMPDYRRRGVGTQLLEAVEGYARSVSARCVWLETQNMNYPAIQFYRRAGFAFCGFDTSLYDPATEEGQETALFFARSIKED